jgi:hypothetical protein
MTSRRRGSAIALKTSAGWALRVMRFNIFLYRNMSRPREKTEEKKEVETKKVKGTASAVP